MKLKIKKEILLEGLNKVSKAISTKNLIPSLSGIKFELNEKGLTLTASDSDITIQTFLPCDENMNIEKEGSIIIQGKYILDIVRKLPDEYINIAVIDNLKIIIYTENSEFNLNGMSKNEYPNINLEESKKIVRINNKEFRNLINQTSFATSNDESKTSNILSGINFKISGNILECNATDTYRLARKTITLLNDVYENYNFTIQSKNLMEFNKILDNGDSDIELHIFNNKVLFKYDNLLFQTGLINGEYPPIPDKLPDECLFKIVVNLDNLYNVIDRASILTSDKESKTVTFEIKNDILYVKSSAEDMGRVEEKMKIKNESGQEINIYLSPKYMMEALKSFEDESVEIAIFSNIKPIIIRGTKDLSLAQLVSPLKN